MSDPFVEVEYGTDENSQTSIRICDVYAEVVDVLLEPSGPKSGLITQGEIIDYILNAASDFLQQAPLEYKLCNVKALAFTALYEQPDNFLTTVSAMYNDTNLAQNDKFHLDNYRNDWRSSQPGRPSGFMQDELEVKRIEFTPPPQFTGSEVEEATGSGFFGTLSTSTAGQALEILVDAPFYGVVSSAPRSQVYVEGMDACIGTISTIVGSKRNFTLIGPTMSPSYAPITQYNQVIPGIPYSFVQYLKYGALARIFTTDGELKDIQRARYCEARFTEGINIARAIMQESSVDSDYGG